MNAQKVFENLAKKGMLITSSEDFEESDMMLLKNLSDEVIFRFKLIENVDTLTCLKMRVDRFKLEVDSCF